MGNDYYVGGVKGMGPKAMAGQLAKLSEVPVSNRQSHLAEFLANHTGSKIKSKDAILCCARAFMYEKTCIGHIHDPPVRLDAYLEEFASDETVIESVLEVRECVGLET